MNNSIIVRTSFGKHRIRASIDERNTSEEDDATPKLVSEDAELHFHASYELFFSLNDELIIKDTLGIHTYRGVAVCIPPFYDHTVLKDPGRFRILFESEGKGDPIPSGSPVTFAISDTTTTYVDCIKRALRKNGAMLRDELAALIKLLFISLYEGNYGVDRGSGIGIENYLIVIDECINSHLAENVTISYIAERLHLSYRQTSRIIKASYRDPLNKILKERRLAKAIRMLTAESLPISEIASRTGFGSESYFYRLFRSEYGITPNEYRKAHMKNRT